MLLCVLMLSLTLGGCADRPKSDVAIAKSSSKSSSTAQVDSESVNPQLVKANTQFGFKLFSQIYQQQSDRNLFISPTSVALALSMTYNGAGGETQQAMARTLELDSLSLEEINQANLALKSTLESLDDTVQLTIANSLWTQSGADFNAEFIQSARRFYQSEVAELDFSNPSASGTVNTWVDRQTNGKISQIVDRLSSETKLLLVNAIYFKGKWSQPFSTNSTQNLPFTLLDGSQKQRPLMSQAGEYRYLNNDIFQAVSVPYGDGNISLYVFLPKKEVGLSGLIDRLNAETWNRWIGEFTWQPGSIKLPRFQLEYEITLNDTLKALGMDIAFDENRSDFSGIQTPPPNLAINQVKHKTFVEVNEEGTEAAASTSVGIVATSVPSAPFEMAIDRPFFCAIRDEKTGTILFLGSIVDP
ncbi:MAG: serpin family protein [Geitlerinemataceae cyanobacterium]